MVSLGNSGGCAPEIVCKRPRTDTEGGCKPPAAARHVRRHRKQKITSRLSDSGFGEDLCLTSPASPAGVASSPAGAAATPAGAVLTPARAVVTPVDPCEKLCDWHRNYGDVGFKIQKDNETLFHPFRCLARQPQVTAEARCKLVSWLIPVHKYFRLSFECCCLAVNIMDRFLASTPVAADCFQLLGVTALLLASKQVEVFSPRISQLLALCCDAFTKEQLCNLECLVLLRLNFRLAAPTLAFFLDYHVNRSKAGAPPEPGPGAAPGNREPKGSGRRSSLAQRVCELSLADYAFNRYLPSLTAVCALAVSGELLRAGQSLDKPTRDQLKTHAAARSPRLIQEQRRVRSTRRSGVDQSQGVVGPGPSEKSVAPVESDILSAGLEGHGHGLAQECRENLALLVSLNEETLRAISAM